MPGNGKVFISHAHDDNDRCAPLLAALDSWGIDYWFDTRRLHPGDSLSREIEAAITARDCFIRICTPAAAESYWVRLETDAFRSLIAAELKHHRQSRVLINLILDPAYQRTPFDGASLFIDATNKPPTQWLAELRTIFAAPSAPGAPAMSSATAPTLVVDAMHRGDHTTIRAAIAAAPPGTRIVVRPGLYREGIILEKPLEIVGEGNAADIVVEAIGADVVRASAPTARIACLTLRQMGGGNWCAVDLTGGRLDLEECDITCQGLSCVVIHNGADARIRRNTIHDGRQAGILVYDQGQGIIEENEIYGNQISAIQVRADGKLTVRRNRLHDGKGSAIYCYERGQAVIEENEISGHGNTSIVIGAASNPSVRHNRILAGKQAGILVLDQGSGLIEDNDIHDNALSGIEVKAGGNPTVRRNRVNRNVQRGIYIHDQGAGIYEHNDLRGNLAGAWLIDESSQTRVRRADNQEQ